MEALRHPDVKAEKPSGIFADIIMRFIRLITIFLFMELVCCSYEDVISYQGILIDEKTDEPIIGAIISIEDKSQSVSSNDSGEFAFKNLPEGEYELSIVSDNYYDKKTSILIKHDSISIQTEIITLEYFGVSEPLLSELIEISLNMKNISNPYNLCDLQLMRTTKLFFIPNNYLKRVTDSYGGEWILFPQENIILISYINPDGYMENVCPTGMLSGTEAEVEINNEKCWITPKYSRFINSNAYTFFTLNHLKTDSDNDGMIDRYELYYGLNPESRDTDNDGIDDLIDPLPTIPFQDNDTTNMLEKCFCFDNNNLWDLECSQRFISYPAMSVVDALPDTINKWLENIIMQIFEFNKDTSQKIKFDTVLLSLTVEQINLLYPYLREIQTCSQYHTEFSFPYLDALSKVQESNIDSVKNVIKKIDCMRLIRPCLIEGDAIKYGAHPKASPEMYLTYSDWEKRKQEWRHSSYNRYCHFKLVKMNKKFARIYSESLSKMIADKHYFLVNHENQWLRLGRKMPIVGIPTPINK